MKQLLSIIVFLISLNVFGGFSKKEQRQIDSLNAIINKKASHDTSLASAYVSLSDILYVSNLDTMVPLCEKAKKIAEEGLNEIDGSSTTRVYRSLSVSLAGALNNLGYFHNSKGEIAKGLDYYHKSLEIQEEIGDKKGLALSLNNIGYVAQHHQGDIAKALEYFHRSAKLQEEIGDKKGLALSLNNIGFIYKDQGEVAKGLDYLHKCLKLYEELENKQGIALSLNNIGLIYMNQGEITKALECFHKSLKLREEIGDKKSIATSLNSIGYFYKEQGDIAKALDYYHKSLKLKEELGDKQGVARSLNNIGLVYKNQGEIAKALDFYDKSLILQEELGNKQGIATNLNNIGMIYKDQGEIAKALEHFYKSLEIQEEIGYKKGQALSLNNIGYVAQHHQDDIAKAIEYYDKSLRLYEELGDKNGIARGLNNIGSLMLKQAEEGIAGALVSSKKWLQRALEVGREIGSPARISTSSSYLSKIARMEGDYKGALEMYELHIQMRDSIKNEETQKAAIRQQTKYEFEKAQLVKKQEEKEASRILAEQTSRRNNLQYSMIFLGILLFFGLVLSLGFIKVSPAVAEGLIFFAFLILFEFLLVLADPFVSNYTDGEPIYNLMANALLAGLIFPAHNFFEKSLKKRIVKEVNE